MRLIKLEAQGFKSFADKVVLTFDGNIVGIVGPNGSGKSNINDAIRWVLGEISPKSLRGDDMEDIIFSGSKTAPPMNEAFVALTFDNSDNTISSPHKQLTITRMLKRHQVSQYYINGQIARLKDIKEIAMESGISKTSLAIISQGTVQDIAQANPEQLRLVFEEAAGVSKYKVRKLEAIRKLTKTTESLDKINAIVDELARQLKPLKNQSEKATIYLQKNQELKEIEITLLVDDITFFNNQLLLIEQELNILQATQDKYDTQNKFLDQEIAEKTKFKLNLENEVQLLNQEFEEVISQIAVHEQAKKTTNKQIKYEPATIDDLHQELVEANEKYLHFEMTLQNQNASLAKLKISRDNFYQKIHEYQLDIDYERNNLAHTNAKLQLIEQEKFKRNNLFYGVKTILENKSLFPKIHGIVADLLAINAIAQQAIATLIKGSLQNLVVENIDEAIRAVNFLKNNQSGRATFIVLNQIKPKNVQIEHLQIAQNQPGFINLASNLVKVHQKHEILLQYLLGNILVVETIEHGRAIFEIFNNYTIVSLDGNVIRPSGLIAGGSREVINLLNYDEEINALKNAQIAAENKLNLLRNKQQPINYQYQQIISTISTSHAQIAHIQQKMQQEKMTLDLLRAKYETIADKKIALSANVQKPNQRLLMLQRSEDLKMLLKVKREAIINFNDELQILMSKKHECDKLFRDTMTFVIEKQNEHVHFKNSLHNSQTRLLNKYELTFANAQYLANKLTVSRDEARSVVNNLKQQIKDLGHVNLEAINDYEKIDARYQKIVNNRDELVSAQNTILAAISEMDKIIVNRLNQIFQSVNHEIKGIFKTMFGGGSACLKYTLPDNLLETGIEVEAQPPGKTIKKIKLFSGGEKSLVAISLLFAIVKAKPLPLCVLDEVEAALDDANVIRYANYLQELKLKTQFIVITHRIGTMTRMDKLYGATMQKRGITSFFSVALAQAKNLLVKNQVIN